MRKLRMLVLLSAVPLAAVACGGGTANPTPSTTPTVSVSVTPSASSTATPLRATADRIEAVARQIYRGDHPSGCAAGDTTCPLTQRLRSKLSAPVTPNPGGGPGPINVFCRCQNAPGNRVDVKGVPTDTGGIGQVDLYGDVGTPIKVDLVMVWENGTLMVDDIRCRGGGEATSAYAGEILTCPG